MEKEKSIEQLLESEYDIDLKRVIRLLRAEMKKGATHISIYGSREGDISVQIYNAAKRKSQFRSAGPSRNVTLPYRQRVIEPNNGNT